MKTIAIVSLILILVITALLFVPVENKQLVEACGPLDKSRYSIILGEKSKYDSYQNETQREAICPTGITKLELYIL